MKLALIPARSGSKRIPRKNVMPFAGKPVIAYSIAAAQACGLFDRIVVSTDDDGIAATARAFGAQTPFIRPAGLSDDHTVIADVIKHALHWMAAQGTPVNDICCIYATAPFVTAAALQAGWQALQVPGRSYALSVTSFPFAVQRALRIDAGGTISSMYPEFHATRSQDLEPCWHDAGQFCWGKGEAFLLDVPVFSAATAGVVLPRHYVQDLDTPEDWHRAELMHRVLRQTGELP